MKDLNSSPKLMFHGTDFPARPFDFLTPLVAPDLVRQVTDSYVYATPYRNLALAYTLKSRFGSSVGGTVLKGLSIIVTFIAHGPQKEGETPDLYFRRMMAHEGYLLRLDNHGFMPNGPVKPGRPVVAEWINPNPARVLSVAKVSGFQAIAKGNIQLFTILKPEEAEARRSQWHEIGRNPAVMGQLVEEGFLCWENRRPELHAHNPALHRQMAAYFGIK